MLTSLSNKRISYLEVLLCVLGDLMMFWGFMAKALFIMLGAEAMGLRFFRAGMFRITCMLGGRVSGFCNERGFVFNFIRKSLS